MFSSRKEMYGYEYGRFVQVWRYRAPFKFSICVDVPALTNDFHEDLEFRLVFPVSVAISYVGGGDIDW